MSKKAALFFCLFFGLYPVYAAQLTISGRVSPINDIIIEDTGLNSGIIGEALLPYRKIPMIKFTLNNNDPDGFYVHFSSANQGTLVSAENEEDRVAYTISTEPTAQSRLTLAGTAEPLPLTDLSLEQDAQLVFNNQVVHATRHRSYLLYVAAVEAVPHRNSYYGDNLTITIHNM